MNWLGHDAEGGATCCPSCRQAVVAQDWHVIRRYRLTGDGRCAACGAVLPGVYDGPCQQWGRRRLPVVLGHS